MTPTRRYVVYALITGLIAGQALALTTRRELWPFSPYPMYSAMRSPEVYWELQLYGVLRDETAEIALTYQHLRPLSADYLRVNLENARSGAVPSPRLIHLLEGLLDHYERLRVAGRHRGPPLSAIRLYGAQWRIDRRAAKRRSPDQRDLLAEARPRAASSVAP